MGGEENILIILSSPSGVGKTTLTKKIQQKYQSFKISVSHTTRPPRSNEVDGIDYHFVTNEEFEKLIKENKFYEYAQIFGNYYGTLKQEVDSIFRHNDIIFDIDWQGTKQIKKKKLRYKIITIFILPPSRKELFNRLLKRDQKDKKIASERMKQFKTDVLHWKDYDFTVINDKVELCYKEIVKFIKKKIKNSSNLNYNKKSIKNHIKNLVG